MICNTDLVSFCLSFVSQWALFPAHVISYPQLHIPYVHNHHWNLDCLCSTRAHSSSRLWGNLSVHAGKADVSQKVIKSKQSAETNTEGNIWKLRNQNLRNVPKKFCESFSCRRFCVQGTNELIDTFMIYTMA